MSQVWMVTGASRGIGRAIADAALAAGHSVVATVRGTPPERPDAETADRLLTLTLDVTDPDEKAYNSVVAATVDRFGQIDVLVNNAGYGLLTAFEETDEDAIRAVMETNVFGLMRVTRAVLPVMRRQRSGHIINISSGAGYSGGGAVPYHVSKWAVTGFSESLAYEVEPFGIRITNAAPGMFRSDFLDDSSLKIEPGRPLADYEERRTFVEGVVRDHNGVQAGDPAALASLLVTVAASAHPPRHLPIGADALESVDGLRRDLERDVESWRHKAAATAFREG